MHENSISSSRTKSKACLDSTYPPSAAISFRRIGGSLFECARGAIAEAPRSLTIEGIVEHQERRRKEPAPRSVAPRGRVVRLGFQLPENLGSWKEATTGS